MSNKILCAYCQEEIVTPVNGVTTGFGRDKDNKIVCYSCCAELDRAAMARDGKITLYARQSVLSKTIWKIVNWPGSLRFDPLYQRKGKHNIGRVRTDVWFIVPDDTYIWHGVLIGDNTELLHCKRTKTPVKPPAKTHYVGMAGLRGYMPNYVTVGETRGSVAEDLGFIHELSGRAIKRLRRDWWLDLDLYEYGNEYCEIVVCDCGKDISAHDDDNDPYAPDGDTSEDDARWDQIMDDGLFLQKLRKENRA